MSEIKLGTIDGKPFTMPLDYATKTSAILAQRRKGKTYTASVMAEEMVAAKQPFVALDPTGAWWGLRASADGDSDGLPVVILGGQHGDVPLERTAGKVIADLVVDSPGYYVIDFSLFESGKAETQFAVDFAERLYRAKAQPGKNFPLHLFVDEADRFVPQNIRNKDENSPRLLGAFEAIVRRGGLRGLGTTLISQRAAVVNKNVLEMLDVLIALRTIGPNDQKAIKAYVQAHGSDEELAAIMGSLASLAIGEAWVWEPGADLFERVQIRKRNTFNSSATPDATHRAVEPKVLAKVDLDVLKDKMAATIERAKADDPKELRAQIAELERQLANGGPSQDQLDEWITKANDYRNEVLAVERKYEELLEKLQSVAKIVGPYAETIITVSEPKVAIITPDYIDRDRQPTEKNKEQALEGMRKSGALDRIASNNGHFQPNKTQQRILDALAWWESVGETSPSSLLVGAIALIDTTGGYFSNLAGPMATHGLIERGSGTVRLTDDGRRLANAPARATTLSEYHDMLRDRVRKSKSANGKTIAILNCVINARGEITTAEIGEQIGMDVTGGYFSNCVGPLSTLKLIERRSGVITPTELLFPRGLR